MAWILGCVSHGKLKRLSNGTLPDTSILFSWLTHMSLSNSVKGTCLSTMDKYIKPSVPIIQPLNWHHLVHMYHISTWRRPKRLKNCMHSFINRSLGLFIHNTSYDPVKSTWPMMSSSVNHRWSLLWHHQMCDVTSQKMILYISKLCGK